MSSNQSFKITADLHRNIIDSIENTVVSFAEKEWCPMLETITADLGQAIRRFDQPIYPDLSTFMVSHQSWVEMLPPDPTSGIDARTALLSTMGLQMTIGEPHLIGPDGLTRDGNRPLLYKETGWFLNQLRIASGTRKNLTGILLPLSREVLGSLTWATLIQYLQFVKDHSNFTTPIMNPDRYPEGATTEEKAQIRMSAHTQYIYDRAVQTGGYWEGIGEDAQWVEPTPLHEMFNEEREEGLEGLILPGQDAEQGPEERTKFTKDEKKDAIRKVMDILDEKIADLLLEAKDYQKYAEVLGEVIKGL